ncbi:FGGY-family carbohydrate kinase [Pedobacter paludis]|uniref:Sugar kinase n=1 Tax=Pedobacter paludis TaxID=2203212 RepID=A0A317F243_9SPHI|nr:FGGY family carbohydrate kinase [Pedobacter paludis]PWS31526.1 sugar kinase [Pedobacter paludis]
MALKEQAYLVVDIGTGNVRVALAKPNGEIISIERENLQYHKDNNYPEALYFEPDTLWVQIQRLAKAVLVHSGGYEVEAITSTSQREGIVLVGKSGKSLIGLPNIDHRGREWENLIEDKTDVYKLTGRYPTSLFSALKVVGIRNKRPEIWSDFSTFMSISDWVEYMFSGVFHYEHSQASETLLYDVEGKKWSDHLCSIFSLNLEDLPNLTHSGSILGKIKPDVASLFSISSEAVIIVGGADTQLAVKSTQPSEADVVIVSGTTTPIIKLTKSYELDEQQRTWTGRHIDEDSFMLEANAGVTGLNYQRLKEVFYPNEGYDVIEEEVNALDCFQCVASLGSLLADEKTPLTRGGFLFDAPVSHQLSRGSFVWATLWDIACSIKENYNSLCNVTSHNRDYIWACGGGVQSKTLRQFIANLLGKKIIICDSYRQSSVVGGVFICNEALGKTQPEREILETVYPQDKEEDKINYLEWKKTRSSFRTLLNH